MGRGKRVVWLVVGSAGEYDEYRTWPVRVFKSKKEANDYALLCFTAARKLNNRYEEWESKYERLDDSEAEQKLWGRMPKDGTQYDPSASSNEINAYEVVEVPFDSLPGEVAHH